MLLLSSVHPLLAYCCCKVCIPVYICCRWVIVLPEDGSIALTAALASGQSQVLALLTLLQLMPVLQQVALCICAEDERYMPKRAAYLSAPIAVPDKRP